MDQNSYTKVSQNIILENRKKLMISGVKDIDSFDDNSISMFTTLGSLIIRGLELKISKFSVETGDVIIEGTINSILYDNFKKNNKKSFWAKIIK